MRSPSRRITLGGALREEGVGAGGAAFHGQHGIRYQQTLSENSLDKLTQEEVRARVRVCLRFAYGSKYVCVGYVAQDVCEFQCNCHLDSP